MLKLANLVLCCASIALCFVLAIHYSVLPLPLAWMLPMTIRSWNIFKERKPNTVSFAVGSLLLVNAIGGVLLLIADKEKPRQTPCQGGVE